MNHLHHSLVFSSREVSLDLDGYRSVRAGEYWIGGFNADLLTLLAGDVCCVSLEQGALVDSSERPHNSVHINRSSLLVIGSDMNTQAIYYVRSAAHIAVFNDLFLARSVLLALNCDVSYEPVALASELTFFHHVQRLAAGERLIIEHRSGNPVVKVERQANILHAQLPFFGEIEESKRAVYAALDGAVSDAVAGRSEVSLALSGGIDSGAVAALTARHGVHVQAYSLATPWGDEYTQASQTAAYLGVPLQRVEVTAEEIVAGIPLVIRYFHFLTPESIEIALVALCLYKKLHARDPSPRWFITGYGSDLLNAGGVYDAADDAGLHAGILRQLARAQNSNEFSALAASTYNVQVRHPYWHSEVIRSALRAPPSCKLRAGVDKVYLREMMIGRLPLDTVWRPKLGAHRGTGLAQHLSSVFGSALSYERAVRELHHEIFCVGNFA